MVKKRVNFVVSEQVLILLAGFQSAWENLEEEGNFTKIQEWPTNSK